MSELNIKYPTHFAFTLIRNIKTGEQKVVASNHGAKGTAQNKKYSSISHFTWNANETTALIDYVRFENEEDGKEGAPE